MKKISKSFPSSELQQFKDGKPLINFQQILGKQSRFPCFNKNQP